MYFGLNKIIFGFGMFQRAYQDNVALFCIYSVRRINVVLMVDYCQYDVRMGWQPLACKLKENNIMYLFNLDVYLRNIEVIYPKTLSYSLFCSAGSKKFCMVRMDAAICDFFLTNTFYRTKCSDMHMLSWIFHMHFFVNLSMNCLYLLQA